MFVLFFLILSLSHFKKFDYGAYKIIFIQKKRKERKL